MSCKKCNSTKCTCSTNICINPLVYAIKSVFSLVGTDSNNDQVLTILSGITKDGSPGPLPIPFDLNLPEALVEVLNSGISISNNKDYCCPDCTNGFYFLGSSDQLQNLFGHYPDLRICCVEHYSSVNTWNRVKNFLKGIGYPNINCCDTDFSEAAQNWLNAATTTNGLFYLEDLINNGIIEVSSFNGYSGLSILFDFLQLNHPELQPEDYLNILGVIMNLGLIVKCDGCNMNISSINTYIQNIG
jgi:hypothetical protein